MTAFNNVDDLYRSLIDESQKEKNEEMEESILETLFRDQRYDLILYALEKGFTLSPERIEEIKISGDLKLYQYLFRNQKLEFNLELMVLAVKSGNLTSKMSVWLELGSNSKLETVKWLREHGCSWNKSTCDYAAKYGYLEILQYARENGCPWDQWTCAYAAKYGQLEILKWLRENGCPWDKWTCAYAAMTGHLEILKWSRENGCPWDQWTCAFTAMEGRLVVLQWARENGCPWNKEYCLQITGQPEIVEWIKAN